MSAPRESEPDLGIRPKRDTAPAEVVRLAAGGDRDAQQEVLQIYIASIRRLISRLVGEPADADDLTQTTAIEVLRSLPRFKGEASLGLWVDRIATRVVYKHYRTSRRRRERVAFVAEPELGASGADGERRIEARSAAQRARGVIERLKPDRRIVFLLVAVEGRSLAEAAAMLGVSLAAAKSRYLRARRDIDRMLADDPELAQWAARTAGEEDTP